MIKLGYLLLAIMAALLIWGLCVEFKDMRGGRKP